MSSKIKNIIMDNYGPIFSQYFSNFSQTNFDFTGDLKGNIIIKLENIDLRKDCFLNLMNFPLIIEEGSIEEMTIQFNLFSLIKIETTDISIKKIRLQLNSLSETYKSKFLKDLNKMKKEDGSDEQENYKKQKLKEWEETMKKQFKGLTPNSWGANLAKNLANNLKIKIDNFSLFYQNYSILETETILKVSFNSLEIFSTNEQWKKDFTYSSDNFQFKMLKANGLSVSLVTAADFKMKEEIIKLKKNPSQFSIKQPILDNQTQYSTNAKKKLDIHMDYLRQEYTERTYKALKELKTSHYLIRPLSIRLKIKVLTKRKSKNENEPNMHFWLSFKKPLIIILNKQQREYLSNMGKHIKSLEIIRSNLHIRPTILFRNNRLEWFRYAVKAVIEQNKKLKLNFKKSTQKITLQAKYISLYKKKQKIIHTNWIGHWTTEDQANFEICEKELEVKDLISYRKKAFIDIKRDFNNYSKEQEKKAADSSTKKKEPSTKIDEFNKQSRDSNNLSKHHLKRSASSSSLIIEDEEEFLEKSSVIFEASLKKLVIFLTNNSTSMKNKYSPANIKLYRECQCPKCTPELYGLNNPNLSIPSGNMKESFITAENFQSFEKSNIYEEEVSSGEENEGILGDIKKEIEDLRLIRKIILMVELTGIDCQISYKDKILKNLDDVPLRICSTAIIDPYSLQRFYREKEDDRQFQAETPEQILNYKEKYREFYISLYDKYKEGILIQLEEREKKEDQEKTDKEDKINAEERDLLDKKSSEAFKRLKQKEFKFFLNFLKFNGNFSYGNFLKKIIKDKDRYDYLHKEDLDKYSVFFDYNSINFLHSDEETRMKFSQFKTKKTTFEFLEKVADEFIKKMILKHYFGYFLEDYGINIIPDLIEYCHEEEIHLKKQSLELKNSSTSDIKKPNDIEIKFQLSKVSFQIEDETGAFKDKTLSVNDILNKVMNVSYVKINIGNPTIFMSTNSIQNLYFYLKSDYSNTSSLQTKTGSNQKEKLLKSILKAGSYDESVKSKLKTKLYIKYDISIQSIMVHIENSSSLYKNYHQILLKFEEISFQSISSLDSFYKNHAKKENISLKQKLEGFKTDHSDAKAHLMKKLEIYKIFAFEIKKISLVQILEFSSPRAKKQDEILKSSFSAIFSLLHSQKTINKIAKKITIGIPFIQFNLSDDMFPFFELLESFRIILSEMDELKHGQKKNEQTSKNKYFETLLKSTAKIQENATSQQKQSNSGKPNSLHEPSTNFGQAKQNNVRQGVADDILIKEFQELCEKHNPKEKIKNCKHCALKKMQSSLLLNIIFGDFPSYFNDFKKTDFYLLDIWMNRNKSISFKDDSESSENGIKILFKTSQKSNPSCCTQIHLPIIIITFDQGFFKNNFTIHTAKAHNPLKNAHGFQTNVILKPFLDVDENILTSMEEKFYLYCHHLDERIPTFLKTEDTDKKEFNDKQIFLVCYRKMISMRDLLESYDGDFQKNRNIFFMKLTEIGAIFQDSSSMIPLINLVRNLTSFKKKFSKFLKSELAYMMLIPDDYDIASYSNEFCEKSGKQRDMSGIQLLKYLENETLYFSVERFYIQFLNMYLNCDNSLNSFQKTPQSIIFQIHNLGVFLTAVNVREIKTIFSIDLIRLSFTSNMQFLLEKINLGKKDDAFLFDLKTIRMVSNRNEKIILIPENEYQDDLLALRIYIKLFSEKIEKIKINIEASQIELSMKTINELVEVLNVPILLSNMEHKEFKVFLKGSILQMEYKGISKDFNKLFENVFNKKEHSISNSFKKSSKVVKVDLYSKNYDVVLELNKLTIRLLERQLDFMIIFEKIGLEIINGQISGYILNFYLKPDREKCFLYTDLIKRAEVYSSPLRRSIDPLITFTRDKRNHKIEISLIKMHIIVINKYFEELLAFKNEISSKFSDLQAQIISKARIKKNDGITESEIKQANINKKNEVTIIINGTDLKLTIPEKSNKTDYVTISIESIRITRTLDTYMAQFPDYDFNTCSFQNIDDKLLIFEKELVIDKEIPSEVFDFNINKLNVYYFFTYDEEKLFLSANQIDLQINKPLNSVVASDIIKKWKFKDLIKINNINSLSLNTNLGIIDLVLKIIKTNTKEDSEIYPYVKDIYEKIIMEVDIGDIDIELETLEVNDEDFEPYQENFFGAINERKKIEKDEEEEEKNS